MAPAKRKRNTSRSTANKRPNYEDSDDDETGHFWLAERILAEKRVGKKIHYLIKWAGFDPNTGCEYEPTWEPETTDSPTFVLLATWKSEKEKQDTSCGYVATRGTRLNKWAQKTSQAEGQPPHPSRKSRILESSPASSTARPSSKLSGPSKPARESASRPSHSSGVISPIDAAASSRHPSPRIEVRVERHISFDPDEYLRQSQLVASQLFDTEAYTQETNLDSSQLFAAISDNESCSVIFDSQSSVGEGSFVPATQQTTGTIPSSSSAGESQEATEDSGILEIVQQASRENSPARSVPETIYGPTTESQSQHRNSGSREQSGVPHTFEVVDSSSPLSPEPTQPNEHILAEPLANFERAPHSAVLTFLNSSPEVRGEEPAPKYNNLLDNQLQGAAESERAIARRRIRSSPTEIAASSDNHALVSQERHLAIVAEPASIEAPASFNRSQRQALEPSQSVTPQKCFSAGQEDIAIVGQAQREAFLHENTAGHYIAPSNSASLDLHYLHVLQVSSAQVGESGLTNEHTPSDSPHSLSPNIRREGPTGSQVETVVRPTYISHENPVQRRDFAVESQAPVSTTYSAASREQNAQVVSPYNFSSSQEDLIESVLPTIEKEEQFIRSSPNSRHDSSQETPDREFSSVRHTSSPIHQPPIDSFSKFGSSLPSRPGTPVLTSSLSIMRTDAAEEIGRQMEEQMANQGMENPFTSSPRINRSNFSTSPSLTTPAEESGILASSRQLLRTGAPPSLAVTEGTRSPSTIPDRLPVPPAPTSLRTIALTQAIQAPTDVREESASGLSVVSPVTNAEGTFVAVPAIITNEPAAANDTVSSDAEELSDADDDSDSASLLNDDLELAVDEYIVPLFIEGRQSDMYTSYTTHKKELLEEFLRTPGTFEPLLDIEKALSDLKAIETHVDLMFAETQLASDDVMDSTTQVAFAAQFGVDNSIKFRFLLSLFQALREQDKHVVIAVDDPNDAIRNIIETFCMANCVNYNMLGNSETKYQSSPAGEDHLLVTIIPSASQLSISPADVIICLDGVQNAAEIRQKKWATNLDHGFVPVLHLVIPQTVGHIERYLSSGLSKRERIHTVLASLAHMRHEVGKPIDEGTAGATLAAAQVAEWLVTPPQSRGLWPLSSIGSVKDIVEFQTQMSQTTSASPMVERTKRPLDDDDLDPAKRMRYTPQPQVIQTGAIDKNEVARIGDPMVGTAKDDASALRAQLEEALRNERAARKVETAHFREQEIMWDNQQTVHEDLSKDYRLLLSKDQATEAKLESMTKNNEILRERLALRTSEIRAVAEQLDAQRSTHLLSDNAQIADITQLRMDLATANDDKSRALKSAQSAESTLEYTKEQYRLAQEAATSAQSAQADLEAENVKLTHAASGLPAKLKALHLDRQYLLLQSQNRALKAENGILKRTLQQKDEELLRARMSGGRPGVGTRATSATPQPGKTRSRAASPMTGRLSNLRNG